MEENTVQHAERTSKRGSSTPFFVVAAFFLAAVIYLFTLVFYRSLEREIYSERTAYLKEITDQIVATTDTISSSQWDLASIFSEQLQAAGCSSKEELAAFLAQEEDAFSQNGLELLAFDEQGNYYDRSGNEVRWQGTNALISGDSPKRQIEITTLPTTTTATDEMIFLFRMDCPVVMKNSGITLTHIAVTRDMSVFSRTFEVPSFKGQSESYIVSAEGTRIYRGQVHGTSIGDAYNVLKTLEHMTFQYGGSYAQLRQAVASGEGCSLEFSDDTDVRYYVITSPMVANGWSLVSIVPSDVVSAKMQQFMNKTLFGMSVIALVVIIAVSLTMFLVARYRSSQKLMRQQAQNNIKLQEAARSADEASRAKTVFLSHMSHDIRTPINGIMGMTDIAIHNMNDSVRVSDCLGKIMSASHHLLSLINDVLDMSRIESGKVQLENAPFYVDSLLDGCYSVIAGQSMEQKLNLQKDFSGVTQPYLRGDELHLRQILINILSNAVKFTQEGGNVSFIAKDRIVDGGQSELTVVISDNGIGMSEEFQKKIFEPFAQAEDGSRSRYKGTGLGMSIVRQLLDLMGGSLELESALGKGSTFTVHVILPIEENAKMEKSVENSRTDLTGMRAMLVEDNELNMEIARYVLEDCGIEVTAAVNGKDALDLFVGQPEGSFDVILMDVMMPVMDGLDATRAIRTSGKADAVTIPVVAMTANAYAEDRRAALDAGMNEHITKPIEREKLIRVLLEIKKR